MLTLLESFASTSDAKLRGLLDTRARLEGKVAGHRRALLALRERGFAPPIENCLIHLMKIAEAEALLRAISYELPKDQEHQLSLF